MTRAREIHKTAGLRTLYWDWTFREGEIHYQKYCGTPPEHLLFGLRKALDMLLAEGLEHAFRRHALLARGNARWRSRSWAEGQVLAFNIPNPAERANSITCILMQGREPQPLLDYCRDKCDVVLGVGLGDSAGKAFRIAHMGHSNAPMVLGTLGAVEMGLKALGIPHGAGGVRRRQWSTWATPSPPEGLVTRRAAAPPGRPSLPGLSGQPR